MSGSRADCWPSSAFSAIGIGIYHERKLYPRTGRFYQAWESLGLVYLNMSLLILSIWAGHEENRILWIVVFTITSLAQVILGARWQNRLLRGFGITFFAIDVFTRYHELFWNQSSLGIYLLMGGVCLGIMGACLEACTRILRMKGGPA